MMAKSWMTIPLGTMLCLMLALLSICILCSANENSSSNRKSTPEKTSSNGTCGHSACFCVPGIPGIPGSPGPAGPAGTPGNHGPEGPMGPIGNKGDKGPRGSQGPQGPKGPQGPAGPPGNKGGTGARGSQGPPGPKGPSGKVGLPGNKGDSGPQGSQGPPGPMGAPGSLGRNWKQCVFKNVNDGKDTGLIRECIFNKTSDNTGLRVFWNGALRITNCHDCCKRWYFTFHGKECSAPAAIDGIVYMVHGSSSKKNLHRVRQIEGVCEKVGRKGNVGVGFWVGNCAGYGSADAQTGWNSVSRIYVEEIPPPQA